MAAKSKRVAKRASTKVDEAPHDLVRKDVKGPNVPGSEGGIHLAPSEALAILRHVIVRMEVPKTEVSFTVGQSERVVAFGKSGYDAARARDELYVALERALHAAFYNDPVGALEAIESLVRSDDFVRANTGQESPRRQVLDALKKRLEELRRAGEPGPSPRVKEMVCVDWPPDG